MKIGYLLLTAIIMVFILASVAEVIYLAIYKKYISKRIANGITSQTGRKSMITPFRFFWVTIGVLSTTILLFFIFGTVELKPQNNENTVYASFESCQPDGIVSNFSADNEIAGYTRKEVQSGAFRFVYYLQATNDENAFPTALLYIENGNAMEYKYQYQLQDDAGFCNSSAKNLNGHNGWYAVTTDKFCGTLTLNCMNGEENGSLVIDFAQ